MMMSNRGTDALPTYETTTSSNSNEPGLPTYHEARLEDEANSAKSKEVILKKLQLYKERAETIRKFLVDWDIRRHEESALNNGIDIVTKATEEDKNKNYDEALKLYDKSVEYFEYAMEHEAKSAKSKEAILKKLQLYKERAETIRKFLADRDIRRHEESALNIAIDTVTQAVEEDRNKNYYEAFLLYETSIEFFEHALDESLSDKSRNDISKKLLTYKERGEIIHKKLIQREEDNVSTNTTEEMHSSTSRRDESKEEQRRSPEEFPELSAMIPQGVTTYSNLHKSGNRWKGFPGLLTAKKCLTKAVLIPAKFPHLFRGKWKPCRGVLLYGPHGTGKFYLSSAVASEANIPILFKVPCRKLSENRILTVEYFEQLFSAARSAKPSIIFLEHVDALHGTYTTRVGPDPMIAPFHKEIFRDDEDNGVIVIGSTEQPWLMASSLIDVFEKRIYVPMPDSQRRSDMFQFHLRCLSNKTSPVIPNSLTPNDISILGKESAGCSALDIARVIQELMRKPERMQAIVARVTKEGSSPDTAVTAEDADEYQYSPDESLTGDSRGSDRDRNLTIVTLEEILESIKVHRSYVRSEDLIKYQECSDMWEENLNE